jgi:hypothetical protein
LESPLSGYSHSHKSTHASAFDQTSNLSIMQHEATVDHADFGRFLPACYPATTRTYPVVTAFVSFSATRRRKQVHRFPSSHRLRDERQAGKRHQQAYDSVPLSIGSCLALLQRGLQELQTGGTSASSLR